MLLAAFDQIWSTYSPQADTYAAGRSMRYSVVPRKRILRSTLLQAPPLGCPIRSSGRCCAGWVAAIRPALVAFVARDRCERSQVVAFQLPENHRPETTMRRWCRRTQLWRDLVPSSKRRSYSMEPEITATDLAVEDTVGRIRVGLGYPYRYALASSVAVHHFWR